MEESQMMEQACIKGLRDGGVRNEGMMGERGVRVEGWRVANGGVETLYGGAIYMGFLVSAPCGSCMQRERRQRKETGFPHFLDTVRKFILIKLPKSIIWVILKILMCKVTSKCSCQINVVELKVQRSLWVTILVAAMFHLPSLWWCDMVGSRLARWELRGLTLAMFPPFGGENSVMCHFQRKKNVWNCCLLCVGGKRKFSSVSRCDSWGEVWGVESGESLRSVQRLLKPQRDGFSPPFSYVSGPPLLPLMTEPLNAEVSYNLGCD